MRNSPLKGLISPLKQNGGFLGLGTKKIDRSKHYEEKLEEQVESGEVEEVQKKWKGKIKPEVVD